MRSGKNFKAYVKNTTVATIFRANLEYEIGSLKYLDELNKEGLFFSTINGAKVTTVSSSFTILAKAEDVYIDVNGLVSKKNLTFYTNAEGKLFYLVEEVVQGAGSIFELSTFKNLTARIPTGSKLTNLKKSEFLTHGYKVKPTNGGLKTQIDDIIANGDNLGAKTEGIVDDIMSGNGYTKMDGKYGSNNGYDGIYIKGTASNPTEIVIIESKQFKYTNGIADDLLEHSGITLNPPSGTTQLPAQMSDGWINYVAGKLMTNPNTSVLGNKIEELMLTDPSKISKYVSAVDKAQEEINFLKLGSY